MTAAYEGFSRSQFANWKLHFPVCAFCVQDVFRVVSVVGSDFSAGAGGNRGPGAPRVWSSGGFAICCLSPMLEFWMLGEMAIRGTDGAVWSGGAGCGCRLGSR